MEARTLTVAPRFTRVGSGRLIADSRYAFISKAAGKGILIDGQRRRQQSVSVRRCNNVDALGGSWMVFSCGTPTNSSYELYNILTRRHRPLTISPSLIASACIGDITGCDPVTAVGADWVQVWPYCGLQHCGPSPVSFQNLETGAVRSDPTSSTTAVNLNSAGLSAALCPPVTVPRTGSSGPEDPSMWGNVAMIGRFALATGAGSFLERCGSRLREFLTFSGTANNSSSIVWESRPGLVTGIFLPSRRRFSIKVPARVDPHAADSRFVREDTYALALNGKTLYLDAGNRVWTMPFLGHP